MFKPSVSQIKQVISFDELKNDFGVLCCDVDHMAISLISIAKQIEKNWVV